MKPPHPGVGHRKRLRERFLRAGLDAFSEHETLEFVLTGAIPRGDVKEAAKTLLGRFKTLAGIFQAPACDLEAAPGVGSAAAAHIKFLHALFGRLLKDKARREGPVLSSAQAVTDYLSAGMSGERDETFRVLFLDAKNRLIEDETLHRGTVNQAAVYPRKILDRAFRYNAVSLILAHNHPSGDPTPSEEDRLLTGAVVRAAGAVDIAVHDHLIVGNGAIFSFRREGLLGGPKASARS